MKIKQFFLLAAVGLMGSACGNVDNPLEDVPNNTPTPATVAIPGLLAGKFTINASGDQVQFSQGNLQYTKSTGVWSFMEHQWSIVETNGDVGADYASQDVVSLFGWVGESSTVLTSDLAKYGISTSATSSDYGTKDGSEGETLKSDWGNIIGTGWRTLTGGDDGEWKYLFSTRTTGGTVFGTAQARYAHAEINTDGTSVKGMILFPDGVDIANAEVTTAGAVNSTSDYATKCTSAQWTALAAKGCVFLPAAGYRNGTAVNDAGTYGLYWSSSPNGSAADDAFSVRFLSGSLNPADYLYRHFGFSVRLVRPAE